MRGNTARFLRSQRGKYRTLALLPGSVAADQIGAGALAGSRGELLTFTRATPKFCTKADGTLVSLSSGQPCVESKGLLIEAAHTNAVKQSRTFATAPWVTQGGGSPSLSGPTVTENAGVAPDGTMTASRLDLAQVGAGGTSGQIQILRNASSYGATISSGTTYVISVFLKGVSGGGTIYFGWFDTDWRMAAAHYTSGWNRFWFTVTAAATNPDIIFGVDLRDRNEAPQPAQSVYAWEFNVTTGAYPLSPVTTTTVAKTCNKDQASLPSTALPVASGSASFDFTPLWATPGATAVLLDTRDGSDLAGLQISVATSGEISFVTSDGSASTIVTSSGATWVAGQRYRLQARWSAGNLYLYRDGVRLASATAGTGHMPSAQSSLNVGQNRAGTNQCDGYISNLKFYRH